MSNIKIATIQSFIMSIVIGAIFMALISLSAGHVIIPNTTHGWLLLAAAFISGAIILIPVMYLILLDEIKKGSRA